MEDRLQAIAASLPQLRQAFAFPYLGMMEEAIRLQLPTEARVLEIGPGATPAFMKGQFPNLRYLDFYSTKELFVHFRHEFNLNVTSEAIPTIDYVCKNGDIGATIPVDTQFDLIFSSHNIEHQPDLLRHLNSLEGILAPQGAVIFLVPDKRCSFDAFRQPSETADVLQANATGRRNPREGNMFSFHANRINLNPVRVVTADDEIDFENDLDEAYLTFLESFNDNNQYIDIHNWVFTPESMGIILIELFMLKKTELYPAFLSDTYGNEFMVMMKSLPGLRSGHVDPAAKRMLHQRRLDLYKRLTFGGGSNIY